MESSVYCEIESFEDETSSRNDLVAVVGMGCRWPGGVRTPSQLWDFILQKKTAYQDFSDAQFSPSSFLHSNPQRPGSIQSRGAHLLTDDPKLFDHAFFGISGTEVTTMDPAQRKLLEVVYEAFESAGETKEAYAGSKTGVFVGNFNNDHLLVQSRDSEFSSPYSSTGAGASILSNRVNFLMDLVGPSVTIDTACSSSLVGLHLAINAIQRGDCNSAIVAGTNLIMGPDVQLMLTKLGALSPTSTCHTFDASADGYARGEGFAAFYLKKLSDAIRDDNPVRAVIRGTAINSNGRSPGLTHPSSRGQEAVIRQAYLNAGLDPKDTGYFEAHGTGTAVGDPIEVAAIGSVFSAIENSPLIIGSIKPNIGHTEATSGLAGMMKAILALEANLIPPTRGIVNLNPQLELTKYNVQVATEILAWPSDKLRRVSVNSFGYGGANAHCILDHVSLLSLDASKANSVISLNTNESTEAFSSRSLDSPTLIRPGKLRSHCAATRRLVLLPFSGHDEKALQRAEAGVLGGILKASLADVAYTLSCRRSRYRYRSYALVNADAHDSVSVVSKGVSRKTQEVRSPTIAFVFTGQGAHWPSMGSMLFGYETFRRTITSLDNVLSQLSFAPGWRIQDILSGKSDLPIGSPGISQTVCTALQVGLVNLLYSWNITPKSTVGHSSGEIAAAYGAGYVSAAEAIIIAYCRGVAVSKNNRKGLMLAVGLGESEMRRYLSGAYAKLDLAAVNSPNSVTISGDASEVTDLSDMLHSQGVFTRILQTGGNAYHSSHMHRLGLEYEVLLTRALEELNLGHEWVTRDPCIKRSWISSVQPETPMSTSTQDPLYWRKNLISTVQFSAAMTKMLLPGKDQVDFIVEIGPHSALKTPLMQIWAEQRGDDIGASFYHPTLMREQDDMQMLLQLCGTLFTMNHKVDLVDVNSEDHLAAGEHVHRHGQTSGCLPPYHFSYGPPLYQESRASKEIRLRTHARHDLLGSRQPGCPAKSPSWRNILRIKDVPWLEHHKLIPHTVFPAAGYICMAVEAAWQVFTEQHSGDRIMGYTLRNVSIQTAMRIPEDDRGLEVTFSLEQHNLPNGVFYRFRISSVTHSDDVWTDHCSGEIRPLTNSATMCEFQAHEKITGPLDPRMLSSEQWYSTFSDIGISYGPSFQAVSDLTSDPMTNTVEAKVALKTTKNHFNGAESSYLLHPASLDACHQLAIVSGHQGHCENAHHAFVPTFFKQVSLWVPKNPSQDSAIAVCCSARRGIRGLYAQIQLVDQAGDPLLSIEDLRCVAYGERNDGERITRRPYRNLAWKPDSLHISQDYVNRAFPPTAVQHDFVTSMNNLSRLCAYIIAEIAMEPKFQLIEHQLKPHMKKFLFWIRRSLRTDDHVLREAASMSSNDRRDVISTLSAQLGAKVEAKLITRIFNNLDDIFSGHKSGLEIALQDGLLSQLYASSVGIAGAYPQLGRLVDLCVFRNSHMNILEIGAGTGGATRVVLETLRPSSPERLFKQYTFTDVSTAFLASARSQFDFGESMVFGTLDFEDDPLGQGYEQRYDLIIASECLHTSRNIEKALRNIRGLLKPQGQLLVVETTRALSAHGLLLGTFPDYWVGTDDCRPDNPFLDEEGWDAVLRRAGFSGIDIRLNDYPCPYNIASVFLSTCLANSVPAPIEQTSPVCLVNRAEGVNICDLVASKCEQLRVPFTQEAKLSSDSGRAICFLRCQDVNDFQSQELFNLVKQVVQHCRSALWVTLPDISNGGNTTAAIMMGLLRVVSAENPQARHAIVDLQGSRLSMIDTNLATQLIRLEEGLQDWQNSKSFEREYIWKNNCLHISRLVPDRSRNANFHPLHSKQRAIEEVPLRGQSPFKVAYEKPGILSSIFFRADPLFVQALPDDYMIVRTEAVGLNWKDAAVALGRFDLNNSSSEFAGVVTQLGSQVRDFSIGDRVYGFAFGNFGNYMRLPACLARRMPEKASFVSMATTPVVFASALYALKRVARLQAHDTVLIQSATGGLGIAAIQVAKLIGATVFATAGSERKRTYLREKHRIPASRIYDSREIPDIKRLLHITGGRGFDVVLNTSSGLIMDATWSAIAAQGRFVDVGRVDVHQNGTISLEPFNRNASFASFDLGRLGVATISELMQEVDDLFQAGAVQPILPVTEFDVAQLGSAIAKLSEGKHLGKVVVNYENLDSTIPMLSSYPTATFDPNASYLIAGGLGGLGRSLVSWMAARGARFFVAMSRSVEMSPQASAFIQRLHMQGITVEPVACDITVRSEVEMTVSRALSKRVVKGVVHMAMVLRDKLFANLSIEEWRTGLAAKVQGTLNLHEATRNIPLDFFVMASSISTQIAQPTQAAYCAANSFQDQFARHRRSQGLPATTIAFGLIHEVGELGRRVDVQNSMSRNDLYATREAGFLHLLEAAFLPQVEDGNDHYDPLCTAQIVTSLEPALLLAKQHENRGAGITTNPRWHSDLRFSHIIRETETLATNTKAVNAVRNQGSLSAPIPPRISLDACMRAGKVEEANHIVLGSVVKRIAEMLFIAPDSLDPNLSVSAYGIDSLVAAELRSWFIAAYDSRISFLTLLDTRLTIFNLASYVVNEWVETNSSIAKAK